MIVIEVRDAETEKELRYDRSLLARWHVDTNLTREQLAAVINRALKELER